MPGLDDPRRFAGLNRRYRNLYLQARDSAGRQPDETAPREHIAFRQQVADLLADLDMSEAERQRLLSTIMCPCCGGTGASVSIELKTGNAIRF